MGFEVLWGGLYFEGRARFCYLLAELHALRDGDASLALLRWCEARQRGILHFWPPSPKSFLLSWRSVLGRYRYRERHSVGTGLQAIGARSLGFVLAFCLFLFVGCLLFLHFFGPLFFRRLN
jgi:hypothetical protein